MTAYFRSIWSARFFLLSLVKYDLNTRYRRSALGIGWSLLQPIGMTIVLCTVFHRLFQMDVKEFGLFLLAGLAFWGYFTGAVLAGCQCYFEAEAYMRQFPAPPAIYPLRATLGAIFHLLMALGIVIVAAWILKGFGNLPAMISLVPALMLLLILGWSVATLAALANTHFCDSQHLIDLALQAMFYMTPIIYPPDMLETRGLGWLLSINPLTSVLELIRRPILTGELPSNEAIATAMVLVSVLFATASMALYKLQRQLVFRI